MNEIRIPISPPCVCVNITQQDIKPQFRTFSIPGDSIFITSIRYLKEYNFTAHSCVRYSPCNEIREEKLTSEFHKIEAIFNRVTFDIKCKNENFIEPFCWVGYCKSKDEVKDKIYETFKNLPYYFYEKIEHEINSNNSNIVDMLLECREFIRPLDMPKCKNCSNEVNYWTNTYCLNCKRMIESKLGHINNEFKTDFKF